MKIIRRSIVKDQTVVVLDSNLFLISSMVFQWRKFYSMFFLFKCFSSFRSPCYNESLTTCYTQNHVIKEIYIDDLRIHISSNHLLQKSHISVITALLLSYKLFIVGPGLFGSFQSHNLHLDKSGSIACGDEL